jgi:transmembrane sensor
MGYEFVFTINRDKNPNMDKQRAEELIRKYLDGTCTSEEKLLVEQWYNQAMDEQKSLPLDNDLETIGDQIYQRLPQPGRRVRPLWSRIAAVASILLALSFGGYFLMHKKQLVQQTAQNQQQDIPPGHNQATLTLANGKNIILTQKLAGKLAQQGSMLIQVNNKNAIAYTPDQKVSPTGGDLEGAVSYNTMSTGIGEQSPYPLVLADGTQILLDTKSSVTFPVAFNGNERRVKVTGKAWFKVNPIANRPFYVDAGDQVTKEIGTEFVIEAYGDEPVVRTTLVEGSIMVLKGGNSRLINPGQQAISSPATSTIGVRDADVEEVTAWIHGYFRFNNEPIAGVMKQLSRWYDIDVQYNGKPSDEGFYGRVSRNKNISVVLKMLQKTQGVHFKIEGRRVTVIQ